MIDLPVNGNDGGDDGGEGGLPPGYDPGYMGDTITPDDYASQPKSLQDRFQRFARKNNELKARLEALEANQQITLQTQARLAAVEQSVVKGPEKPAEGLAAYSDADLRAWKSKALKAQQAYLADPSNEALRDAVAQINPEHLMAVDEELVERRVRAGTERATSTLKGEWQADKQQQSFEQKVGLKYGVEYVRKGTPEYAAAVAEFAEIAKDFDVSKDTSGAYTLLAIERAKMKLSGATRDGRGGDAALRRLAIEGQGRREAQLPNSIAALQAKGDWKSKGQAVDLQIDQALKGMYGG